MRVTRPDGSVVTGDGSFVPWPTAYDTVTTAPDGSFAFDYILDGIGARTLVEVLDDATAANVLASTTFTDATIAYQTGAAPTGSCASPGNAQTADNIRALCDDAENVVGSDFGTGLGLQDLVPSTATDIAFTVQVQGRVTNATGTDNFEVELSWDPVLIGQPPLF